jgi:hypothetical protein
MKILLAVILSAIFVSCETPSRYNSHVDSDRDLSWCLEFEVIKNDRGSAVDWTCVKRRDGDKSE